MSDNQNTPKGKEENSKKHSEGRRDTLKALATIPVLGAMAYGVYQKKRNEHYNKVAGSIFSFDSKAAPKHTPYNGNPLRIGIIGFGLRGEHLLQALGYATPQHVENLKALAKK